MMTDTLEPAAQLAHPFARCQRLFPTPELRDDFERWALGVLDELVAAERKSRRHLEWVLTRLRLEVLDAGRTLEADAGVSARTRLMQLARRDWLEAVLALAEALTDAAA